MYYVHFYKQYMDLTFDQEEPASIEDRHITTIYRETYSDRMEARLAAAAYARNLWDRSRIFQEWMPVGEKTDDYRAMETTRAFYDNDTKLYYTYVLETNKEEA